MNDLTIQIRDVDLDGYPEETGSAEGSIVFLFDGCWVSGWPLRGRDDDGRRHWEADSDVGRRTAFAGVRYWTHLPRSIQ